MRLMKNEFNKKETLENVRLTNDCFNKTESSDW